MIIGTAFLNVRIVGVQSLKEKRSILLSVLKRTRNKFNVSAAEVGAQDLWQKAEIGIAVVSGSSNHVEQQLRKIVSFIESEPRFEIMSLNMEIL
ncbi:MAG: DUF503 domain-containing protein [Firmicutes bacterium]|nr:DUF503 domain-containing protein [Bacillota bacterium]